MTYRLVQEPARSLTDLVDLSRHVRDVSSELRDARGRWTRGVPGVWKRASEGKHLTLQTEPDRYPVTETDPKAIAAKIETLVDDAQKTEPGSTEWENTWAKVNSHVDALGKGIEKTAKPSKPQRREITKPGLRTVDEVAKDTAVRVRDDQLAAVASSALIHVTAAGAGLIGAEQALQFSEVFSRMAENPVFEAGMVAAIVLAIHALVVKIRNALAKRRDARIKAARTNSRMKLSPSVLSSDAYGHAGLAERVKPALNTNSPFHIPD